MVVCQQLGLTYHPDFGLVHQQVRSSSVIELSSVACTNLDTDIRECHSIKRGDFDCQFDNVVYLRCQKPTWSGRLINIFLKRLIYFILKVVYINEKKLPVP